MHSYNNNIIINIVVPTVPRNLNVVILTNNDVMLTWIRPDPPNGLITEYNVSDTYYL